MRRTSGTKEVDLIVSISFFTRAQGRRSLLRPREACMWLVVAGRKGWLVPPCRFGTHHAAPRDAKTPFETSLTVKFKWLALVSLILFYIRLSRRSAAPPGLADIDIPFRLTSHLPRRKWSRFNTTRSHAGLAACISAICIPSCGKSRASVLGSSWFAAGLPKRACP
jgi:hypothetical protein